MLWRLSVSIVVNLLPVCECVDPWRSWVTCFLIVGTSTYLKEPQQLFVMPQKVVMFLFQSTAVREVATMRILLVFFLLCGATAALSAEDEMLLSFGSLSLSSRKLADGENQKCLDETDELLANEDVESAYGSRAFGLIFQLANDLTNLDTACEASSSNSFSECEFDHSGINEVIGEACEPAGGQTVTRPVNLRCSGLLDGDTVFFDLNYQGISECVGESCDPDKSAFAFVPFKEFIEGFFESTYENFECEDVREGACVGDIKTSCSSQFAARGCQTSTGTVNGGTCSADLGDCNRSGCKVVDGCSCSVEQSAVAGMVLSTVECLGGTTDSSCSDFESVDACVATSGCAWDLNGKEGGGSTTNDPQGEPADVDLFSAAVRTAFLSWTHVLLIVVGTLVL